MMGVRRGWYDPIGSRILAQNDAKRKQIMLLLEISNFSADEQAALFGLRRVRVETRGP
jgi:hypothetical protein